MVTTVPLYTSKVFFFIDKMYAQQESVARVPFKGLPWAAVLSETYAAGELSFHLRLFGDSEFLLIADASGIQDIERTGGTSWGPVIGAAAGLDLRFGKWFVNARFGYSFVPAYPDNRHFTGLFIGFGRSFSF
jgi:hypothetical protein